MNALLLTTMLASAALNHVPVPNIVTYQAVTNEFEEFNTYEFTGLLYAKKKHHVVYVFDMDACEMRNEYWNLVDENVIYNNRLHVSENRFTFKKDWHKYRCYLTIKRNTPKYLDSFHREGHRHVYYDYDHHFWNNNRWYPNNYYHHHPSPERNTVVVRPNTNKTRVVVRPNSSNRTRVVVRPNNNNRTRVVVRNNDNKTRVVVRPRSNSRVIVRDRGNNGTRVVVRPRNPNYKHYANNVNNFHKKNKKKNKKKGHVKIKEYKKMYH